MEKQKINSRPKDRETVYSKNAVTDHGITVYDYTMYNDLTFLIKYL